MSGVRLDLLLTDCVGHLVKTVIEPRCNNIPMWDGGLRDIVGEKLKEMGVPSSPVTVIDAARYAGILGKDPNVVEVEILNKGKHRKRRSSDV